MRGRHATWIVVASLVAVVLVAYAAPLFGGATFVGRDHLTHTLPTRYFLAESLRAGHLPGWWPYVDLGVPYAANPNHSAFYPPLWLVALLPMPWSADFVLVLHVLLAGLGMAAFATRLGAGTRGAILAGAIFTLTLTPTVVQSGPALTLAWMPWVAWATDRIAVPSKRLGPLVLGLAAFAAVQLFAGDPSFAIISALVSAVIGLARGTHRLRTLGLVVAAHVAAFFLAAIVVVPALLLTAHSERAGGIADSTATMWSMHPFRLFELFWPGLFGDPNQNSEHLARAVANAAAPFDMSPGWLLSVYVSLPVLVLAVIGCVRAPRWRQYFLYAALGFLLLALGRYTPAYGLFRTVFLPERLVRYPEKYLFGTMVFVCAFAGLGWTRLEVERLRPRSAAIGAAIVGAIVIALAVFRLLVLPGLARASSATLVPALDVAAGLRYATHGGIRAAIIGAAVTVLLLARYRHPRLSDLALVVLAGHFVARTWALLPTFDRDVLAHRPAILGDVEPHRRLSRPFEHLTRPDDTLAAAARTLYEGGAANIATRFGFDYLIGYDQGHPAEFAAWRDEIVRSGDRGRDLYGVDLEIVRADETGERRVLATDAPFGPYALVANRDQRPRAFVAPRWQWFATDAEAARTLLPAGSTSLDPETRATVHLAGRGRDQTAEVAAIQPCDVHSSRPEVVDLTCESASGGYAVLLDAWSPGWAATVDGVPATIERADLLVRAVQIGPGKHAIAFRYTTPGLRTSLYVSIGAWLIWIVALYLSLSRRTVTP